jgi:hypothetical protein
MPRSTSSKVKGKGEDFTNYLHLVTFAQAAPELRSMKKSSTLLSPGKGSTLISPGKGSTLISPGKSSTLVQQNPDSAITKFVRLSACVSTISTNIDLFEFHEYSSPIPKSAAV